MCLPVIRILACLSLFFFLVPVTYVHGPPPPKNISQYINLEPVGFDSDNPHRTNVGRLEFLGSWKLSSDNDDFGGVSAMLILKDPDQDNDSGNRFFMLSDAGVLMGFTLDEINNRAVRPFIAPLPDGPPPETEFARKNWDAESFVHNPDTGQFWVGYERYHGVWRYGPSIARKEAARQIDAMQKWPENGGAEAMLRFPGKQAADTDKAEKPPSEKFIIFSESAEYSKGGYQAVMFNGDPAEAETKSRLFGYQPPTGYYITDAAILPNGQALLLHRRLNPLKGFSAILSVGDLDKIKTGQVWTAQKIATLNPPVRLDNMEAVAVTQDDEDITIWLASDDNFNNVQETLLMKFRLLKGKTKRAKLKPRPKNEKAEASPGFSSLPD